MNINMKMQPVVKEIIGLVNNNGDTTKAAEVKAATKKWELNREEVKFLCRRFGLLMEDVE